MRRLFDLFLKEKKIDLTVSQSLQDLTIKFNTWLYQIKEETKKRRFSSTDRVNKFMVGKWVNKITAAA